METVKLEYDYEENDDRRLYVKGKISGIICPTCKKKNTYKFDPSLGQYLDYPEKGKKTAIYFCCEHEDCEEDIEIPMVIKDISITIQIDKTKVKKQ